MSQDLIARLHALTSTRPSLVSMDEANEAMDEAADELARLRAEVERLTKERDGFQAALKDEIREHHDTLRISDQAEAALSAERQHADALAETLHDTIKAYSEPDSILCCNGHMCGCRGSTVRDMADHYATEILEAHRARRQG